MLMLTGTALMGTLTATVASFFVSQDKSGLRDRGEQMQEQLDRIEQLLHAEAAPQDLPVAGDR